MLSSHTLQELRRELARTAVALIQSERKVADIEQAFSRPAPAEPAALSVSQIEFAPGRQDFVEHVYTGPKGGYYEAHTGYVIESWAPAGVSLLAHHHPDAAEMVFVRSGMVLNNLTGLETRAGEVLTIPAGEVHQLSFPVDTRFTLIYQLMPTPEHIAAGRSGSDGDDVLPDATQAL